MSARKVQLKASQELEAIDSELDAAMGELDVVNSKIVEMLQTVDGAEGSRTETQGADPTPADGGADTDDGTG